MTENGKQMSENGKPRLELTVFQGRPTSNGASKKRYTVFLWAIFMANEVFSDGR
ncbi:hypothetical protein ACFL6F_04195 [Planctomycetota bacterium]